MSNASPLQIVAGAAFAAAVTIAVGTLPAGAQGGGTTTAATGCTPYPYTDVATGQTGTICLPIPKPSVRAATPNVYCESRNCVITAARASFKPGAIAKLKAGGAGGGATSGNDDVCIIYKVIDPWGKGGGEVCIAADLSAGDVACISVGSAGSHCVVIQE